MSQRSVGSRFSSKTDLRVRILDIQMAGANERRVLRQMFQLFKNMPHLWNKKNTDCSDKRKLMDMLTLLRVYREYDQFATLCTVRRKLNTLIKSYVMEWQRIKLARYTHPDEPHKHKPTLWHFGDFTFMSKSIGIAWSAEFSRKLEARCGNGRTPDPAGVMNSSTSITGSSNTSAHPASSSQSKGTPETDYVPNVFLKRRMNAVYEPHRIHQDEDEKDEIEKLVDAKLQGADEEQKKIALKLISDTLSNASMGKLTHNTFIQLGTRDEDVVEVPN